MHTFTAKDSTIFHYSPGLSGEVVIVDDGFPAHVSGAALGEFMRDGVSHSPISPRQISMLLPALRKVAEHGVPPEPVDVPAAQMAIALLMEAAGELEQLPGPEYIPAADVSDMSTHEHLRVVEVDGRTLIPCRGNPCTEVHAAPEKRDVPPDHPFVTVLSSRGEVTLLFPVGTPDGLRSACLEAVAGRIGEKIDPSQLHRIQAGATDEWHRLARMGLVWYDGEKWQESAGRADP